MPFSHGELAARPPRLLLRRIGQAPKPTSFGVVLVGLFLGSLAFPDSLTQNFAGLHLPIYRIFLVALFAIALGNILRTGLRIASVDWLIVGFAVLQAVSLMIHYGPFDTVYVANFGAAAATPTNMAINAGTTIIESLGSYLIARTFIRTKSDALTVMRVLIVLVMAIGVLTIIESVTGVSAFGSSPGSVRYGLYRAVGPFPGPIQWGLFAASAFTISIPSGVIGGTIVRRAAVTIMVLLAALSSVSSAVFAAIAVQIALLLWFYASGRLPHRGAYFAAGCVAAYLFVDVFSNRTPTQVLFSYAAMDPWTGYYRTLIWQFGWADFLTSPLIGIGYHDWARPRWMTPSIDAFWLVILLRYGLLAAIPLFAGIATAMLRVGKNLPRLVFGYHLDLAHCWLVTLSSLLIAGFTVHFWQQNYVELFLLLGMWPTLLNAGPGNAHLVGSSAAQ